jgi:FixJ family two-component response regulator
MGYINFVGGMAQPGEERSGKFIPHEISEVSIVQRSRESQPQGTHSDSGDQALVAIVDDDPSMIKLVKLMLSTTGVRAESFTVGGELFKSPALKKFGSIVLDLSIQDTDGFRVMDQLAARNITVPIVLISGHDDAVLMAAKAYGNGIGLNLRGALSKPFSQQQLLGALDLPLGAEG